MPNTYHNIERLHKVIENSLFMTTGNLNYDRITDAIIKLANVINDYDEIDEFTWYIGQDSNCCIANLIVGAFWHYTEWHGGQWSKEYAALSQLGLIFSPGFAYGPEPDSGEFDAYQMLNDMAKTYHHYDIVDIQE